MIAEIVTIVRSFLDLGGPVVAILLVISIFALALIAIKFWQFWRENVARHNVARRAVATWQRGQKKDALEIVDKGRNTVEVCLSQAMRLSVRGIVSKEQIEEEVGRIALVRLHDLQKGFRALEAVAQITPLLGLFGTVLGMIEAFQNLQSAGNTVDPSILAGGIWVALLTTAVGLAIAMPVSLILTWFETRVEDERVAVETLVAAVLNGDLSRQRAGQSESPSTEPENLGQAAHAY